MNEPELAAHFSERAIPKFREDQPLKKEPPDVGKTFYGPILCKIRSFSPRWIKFQALLSKVQSFNGSVRNFRFDRKLFVKNSNNFRNFRASLFFQKLRKENLEPGDVQAFETFQNVGSERKLFEASTACNFSPVPTGTFRKLKLPIGSFSKLKKENLHPGEIKTLTIFEKCDEIFEQSVGPNPFNFALAKFSVLNFARNFSEFQPFLSPIQNCLPLDKVPKTNKENLDPGIFGVKFQQAGIDYLISTCPLCI